MIKWRRPDTYWEVIADEEFLAHGLFDGNEIVMSFDTYKKAQKFVFYFTELQWNTYHRTQPERNWHP